MIHPWHMWGGAAQVTASTSSAGLNYRTQGQLARIEYKRPESWRFLFYAKVLRSQTSNPAILDVQFFVIPGVGRASTQLGTPFDSTVLNLNIPFERFRFLLPIGTGGAVTKWSTSVNGPVRDDTAVVPPVVPTPNVVDSIPAQDLQVSYAAQVQLTLPGDEVQAELGVLLAPWHHARPDWQAHKFVGEELGGK
jgi:hypothetical protein